MKFLSDNGIYIIEDIYFIDKKKIINYFKGSDCNYSIVDINHEKNIANNCAVVVRKNV